MQPRMRRLLGGWLVLCATVAVSSCTAALPRMAALHSPLPLPSIAFPVPTVAPIPGFQVVDVQRVASGPYFDMRGSPDGTKVLLRKNQYLHSLYLNFRDPYTSVPLGADTGLAELWLLDLSTNEEKLLARGVGQYTWSPDSKQVAYIAPTKEVGIDGMLYVVDLATGTTKPLAEADFLGSDYAPQWLPNGQITFMRDGKVLKIRADHFDVIIDTGLHFGSWVAVEAGKQMYAADPHPPVGIHFSPNGKRIAYITYNPRQRTIADQLWLADADGSNAQLITQQAEGGYYEWSPDSQWLVFDTYRDLDDPELDVHLPPTNALWVVRAEGTDAHLLYKVDLWRGIISPQWSMDSALVLSAVLELSDYPGMPENGQLRLFEAETAHELPLNGVTTDVPIQLLFEMWWDSTRQRIFITQGDYTTKPIATYGVTLATD